MVAQEEARSVEVGFGIPPSFWRADRSRRFEMLDAVERNGFDHIVVSDHVAFRGGAGRDGLIQAAMLSSLTDLPIHIGVLLLGLRHPTLVARQAIDIVEQSGNRVTVGVGVGGEDPEEFQMCGVDPSTRGARVDEALPMLRQLLDGAPMSHSGSQFTAAGQGLSRVTGGRIPITVGGGAAPALRRAADHDGWLGAFCSPSTWAERATWVSDHSQHDGPSLGLQIWAGLDPEPTRARELVEDELEQFYGVPGAAFAKYTPAGSGESLVEFAQAYIDVGLTRLNVFAIGDEVDATIDEFGRVAATLRGLA